ncbi:hypothetical protein [Tahibacter sp.]|uniref:hypothetical protein n=1 Tax=Tahibacter sp. TaxID=2056211 RepID=UPI0028C42CCC|nr:hypothetical protein [Tahibacter sp.]
MEPGRPLQKGDVAWCEFPYPGLKKKLHPVLILQTLIVENEKKGGHYFVVVSGGTSIYGENGRRRLGKKHELHVQSSDPEFEGTNLDHPTKFSLAEPEIVILPYTAPIFRLRDLCDGGSPVIGHLDLTTLSMRTRLRIASEAVGGLDEVVDRKIDAYNAKRGKD